MTKFQAAALATLGLALAQPAAATLYNATYTGTLTGSNANSYDGTGIFGAPTTGLSGLPVKVVYTIDDALPGAVLFSGVFGGSIYGSYVAGGTQYNTPALPVSATVTINGVTRAIVGSSQSIAQVQNNTYTNGFLHYVTGDAGYVRLFVNTYPDQPYPTGDFRAPLSYDLPTYDQYDSGGGFSIYRNDATLYEFAYGQVMIRHVEIGLAPTGVPEPASWALMIAGVAMAGAALRASRKRIVGA